MMAKTAVVRARIEPKEKNNFVELCENLGVSQSDAIHLLIRKAIVDNGIPEIKLPNEMTRKAIEDSRANQNVKKFESFDDLLKDLKQ